MLCTGHVRLSYRIMVGNCECRVPVVVSEYQINCILERGTGQGLAVSIVEAGDGRRLVAVMEDALSFKEAIDFGSSLGSHRSPQTQNELIEVMGKHIVLRNIVYDLKAARWYAILADEGTSHSIEHLTICARFIDQNSDIREEFLAFIGLDRITGAEIADAIISSFRTVMFLLQTCGDKATMVPVTCPLIVSERKLRSNKLLLVPLTSIVVDTV